MTDKKFLIPFFKLLPEKYQSKAVIAGGAVLNLIRARDVDIFLLDSTPEDLEEIVSNVEVEEGWDCLLDPDIADPDIADPDSTDYDVSHVRIYPRRFEGKIVQLISSTRTTIEALLNSFDLSISMHGLDYNGIHHYTERSTLPGQPIVVHQLNPATANRLVKYAHRFGPLIKERTF